jgi:hypothetical protein
VASLAEAVGVVNETYTPPKIRTAEKTAGKIFLLR